jgi:hypothetical protein
MKTYQLTNISIINRKAKGACRRMVKVNGRYKWIYPGITYIVTEADISSYRFKGEITDTSDSRKWERQHVLCIEEVCDGKDDVIKPPVIEPEEPEVSEAEEPVEPEVSEIPANDPEYTLEELLKMSPRELNTVKLKNHVKIGGYKDMSHEQKADAVFKGIIG